MKTTIDLADELFARARDAAQREGRTLRSLVEEGLRLVLAQHGKSRRAAPFRLKTFAGKGARAGLTAEFEGAGWPAMRDALYGDNGRGDAAR